MRPPLLATLLLCLLSAAGCGGDAPTAPTLSFVGTWNLKTVNNVPLPYQLQASGPKVEVMTDQFVITEAGTFTESFMLRLTSDAGVAASYGADTGRITRDGSTVTFSYASGTLITGVLTTNSLTVLGQGFAQVYERGAP